MKDVYAVQLRPEMYVGDLHDGTGLHNILYAALDDAVAETLSGSAAQVAVDLYLDGSCTVTNDGQGVPITVPGVCNEPRFPEMLLTEIGVEFKYNFLAGRKETIQNTGLVPITALSKWLELRTVRDGAAYSVRFETGKLTRPLQASPELEKRSIPTRGTSISFLPNSSVFTPSIFDVGAIRKTLGAIFIATGLEVALTDHR